MKKDDEEIIQITCELIRSKDSKKITHTVYSSDPIDMYNYLGILQKYIHDERAKDPALADPDSPGVVHH